MYLFVWWSEYYCYSFKSFVHSSFLVFKFLFLFIFISSFICLFIIIFFVWWCVILVQELEREREEEESRREREGNNWIKGRGERGYRKKKRDKYANKRIKINDKRWYEDFFFLSFFFSKSDVQTILFFSRSLFSPPPSPTPLHLSLY